MSNVRLIPSEDIPARLETLAAAIRADDRRTSAEAAARMLWNVRPTDRALRGWNNWDAPDANGETP